MSSLENKILAGNMEAFQDDHIESLKPMDASRESVGQMDDQCVQ